MVGPCAGASPLCLGCHCPLQGLQPGGAGGYRCTTCGAQVCDDECEKLAAHSEWECRALAAGRGALFSVAAGDTCTATRARSARSQDLFKRGVMSHFRGYNLRIAYPS